MARPLIAVLNACITLALAQQKCPDCSGYSGLSRSDSISLAVTCSQTHINVTINNTGTIVGGLLGYVCNYSNNATCSSFVRGTLPFQKKYSAITSLQPGTECVVFGCYYILPSTKHMYKFEENHCSVPAHSSVTPSLDLIPSTSVDLTPSTSVDLTPSTSVDLTPSTSVDLTPSTSVDLTPSISVDLTPSTSVDVTSTTSMGTVTLFVSSTSNTILIIIGSVVIILAVLGSVLFFIIIVKKIRRGKAQNYTEWIDSNYKPVKITGVARLSLSLATLIESLENTQKDCAKEQTCKDSPKKADSSPTHTAEKSDMVEEISPCHSAEQKDSFPPFGTNSELAHHLNASDSNSSLPSSFTKEQEIVDVSITDSSQQNAMSLESEVTYDTDLSSYTSEVSQY